MLNSLRLKRGFNQMLFERHSGLAFDTVRARCERAMNLGLMQKSGAYYAASEQGYLFLNDLISLFQNEND
jgi:oxygen-independent coproporphyrinogen-3 oxidase